MAGTSRRPASGILWEGMVLGIISTLPALGRLFNKGKDDHGGLLLTSVTGLEEPLGYKCEGQFQMKYALLGRLGKVNISWDNGYCWEDCCRCTLRPV